MQDIEIDHARFDDDFVVKANTEQMARDGAGRRGVVRRGVPGRVDGRPEPRSDRDGGYRLLPFGVAAARKLATNGAVSFSARLSWASHR